MRAAVRVAFGEPLLVQQFELADRDRARCWSDCALRGVPHRPLHGLGRRPVGNIDVDPFLSQRLILDEVNRGFELMHAQDGIRT
jgi:hypothetical protein